MGKGKLSMDVQDHGLWEVTELLIRYIRAITELNRRDLRHEGLLSPQQVRALIFLVHHDGASIKELAQALSLSEPRASRLADELVDAGHVLHERDANDRRQVRLHIAPATAEKARRMYMERSRAIKAALGSASEEELRVFTHYLGQLVDEVEGLAQDITPAEPEPLETHISAESAQ